MDNAISNTVTFTAEGTATTRRWLQQHYTQGVKSISFMTRGKHAQVPYQALSAGEMGATPDTQSLGRGSERPNLQPTAHRLAVMQNRRGLTPSSPFSSARIASSSRRTAQDSVHSPGSPYPLPPWSAPWQCHKGTTRGGTPHLLPALAMPPIHGPGRDNCA